MKPCTLLYFVKYPESGRVKTRLAKAIGAEEAARVYGKLTQENLNCLTSLDNSIFHRVIVYDPPQAENLIKNWLPEETCFLPQRGQGLGERLKNAFEWAFREGVKKVIAIGSDTLGLEAGFVEEASRVLDNHDLVLGPAEDGGYYLIGLSRLEPGIFDGIAWSTSEVLSQTVSRASPLGLSYHLLVTLRDLDQKEDLNEYRICRS